MVKILLVISRTWNRMQDGFSSNILDLNDFEIKTGLGLLSKILIYVCSLFLVMSMAFMKSCI